MFARFKIFSSYWVSVILAEEDWKVFSANFSKELVKSSILFSLLSLYLLKSSLWNMVIVFTTKMASLIMTAEFCSLDIDFLASWKVLKVFDFEPFHDWVCCTVYCINATAFLLFLVPLSANLESNGVCLVLLLSYGLVLSFLWSVIHDATRLEL